MTQEGHRRCGGDGLGKKADLERLEKLATRRFIMLVHQHQRRVRVQEERKGRGGIMNKSDGWTSEEEAALEWAVSEGCRHGPGPAVRNLRKTQHELGKPLNQLVPQFDACDPAAHLTNNTRRMLSRLGVGRGGDDDNADMAPRHPHGGVNEGTAYPKWYWHQQQGGGEWEKEPKDTELTRNEVDAESMAEDERPCGKWRCCGGGTEFQEGPAQAFWVAMREDKRLKRKMEGIVSRALGETREEQRLAVTNRKKVVRLLHRCLTRTLSEKAELLAQKDQLEADLLRTELEVEETSALVSSLLAGQGPVVTASENVDGSTTEADGNDLHPCHASLGCQASVDDASSTGSSTNQHGAKPEVGPPAIRDDFDHGPSSLDVNTSNTGSSTNRQGVRPVVGVLSTGGDFDHGQGFPDGPRVEVCSSGTTNDSTGDALVGSPVVLSPVTEVSKESLGSDESATSGSALRAEDVASLATFKALVTKHEASRALQERDRVDRTARGRLARSAAVSSKPTVDRSAPSSKSPTTVVAAPGDAESSGSDDGLSLRCSGSASVGASFGSSPESPPVATPPAPAAVGIEMSYCLPRTATKPRSGLQRSADTRFFRFSSTPERSGLPPRKGHHYRPAAVAPGARSTNAVGDEGKPAGRIWAVGTRARIRHQPVPDTCAVEDPASLTVAHGEGLLRGHPLATGRAACPSAAAAAFPAKGCCPRQAHGEREKPAAGPKTTDTVEELDSMKRAISKGMLDRLLAVMTEHLAAVEAVAQSSASTATRKPRDRKKQATCCGADIMNARPLLGRQGGRRPLSSLQIDAGYRILDFFDRFSPRHGGLIEVDAQGSAASAVFLAERGRKMRAGTSSGIWRVMASPRSGTIPRKSSGSTPGGTRKGGIQPAAGRASVEESLGRPEEDTTSCWESCVGPPSATDCPQGLTAAGDGTAETHAMKC